MDEELARLARAEALAALNALRAGQRADAGAHFRAAFALLERIADAAVRRAELGPFAMACDRAGFHDLALAAAASAVATDAGLADRRHLAQDLLTRGNARMHLGHVEEAIRDYREALHLGLGVGDYADAAAAATNLALVLGAWGDAEAAVRALNAALCYLELEPSQDTEIAARIALVGALTAAARDPDLAIGEAELLLARLGPRLRPHQRAALAAALEAAVPRYLQAHPGLDARAWTAEHFAGVLG